ncbi:MAG TPA: hypothetical protein VJ110_00690 [Candidatus Nanoarchaeia archaeon]|nr:hypothetical protein [Candidatus Nanoarchaeia archaeon]
MAVNVYKMEGEATAKVKAVLEAADKKDPATGKWVINEFVTTGYKLTDARGLGLEGSSTYVYIKAGDDFFKKNEKALLDAGAKKLSGGEYNKVKGKFEESEEAATEGFGSIFG